MNEENIISALIGLVGASPCGNTSDFDMQRIHQAEEGTCTAKLQILKKLSVLAAQAYQKQVSGAAPFPEPRFFYKALSYISSEREEADLLQLLEEANQY